MRKSLIPFFLILILAFGGGVSAQGEHGEKLIKVMYRSIKVVINGRLLNTPAEPFLTEEGHLMIPARAVGEAIGCSVEWDPETNVVYIINQVATDRQPASKPAPVYVEQLPVLRNVGPFFQLESRKITIASRPFNHGLVVELTRPVDGKKEDETPGYQGEAVVQLPGKHSWLEGYLGVDDETRNSRGSYRLQVFGDGSLIYESKPIKPAEYAVKIRVNVETVRRLSFVVQWQDNGLGEYDRLWAALADLQVY